MTTTEANPVRQPITHDLKTWPTYFRAVKSGAKGFEVRINDRDFRVGDTLRLREFDPDDKIYSGDEVSHRVTYILQGRHFGLPDGVVIMSLGRSAAPVSGEGAEGFGWPEDAGAAWRGDFAEALTMTGCADLADLIDMANVGKGLMDRIDELMKSEGPFKGWAPADDPGEIVFDLANALTDALAAAPPASQALAEPKPDTVYANDSEIDESLGAEVSALLKASRLQAEAQARIEALEAGLAGFDDEYMTSEKHHPGHVLIPVEVFERVRALLSGSTPKPAGVEITEGMRPEVLAFARLMEAQLRANDHKPGWKREFASELFPRISEEAAELHEAILFHGKQVNWGDMALHLPEAVAMVGREAADVANFAMMIADVCGALALTAAPSGDE